VALRLLDVAGGAGGEGALAPCDEFLLGLIWVSFSLWDKTLAFCGTRRSRFVGQDALFSLSDKTLEKPK